MSILTWLQSALTFIEGKAKPIVETGEEVVEKDLPAIGIAVAQALLAAIGAPVPFAVLTSTLTSILESKGIAVLGDAATAMLNKGESELIAAGTPSVMTVANTAAAVTATPLPADHPAVIAATAAAAITVPTV